MGHGGEHFRQYSQCVASRLVASTQYLLASTQPVLPSGLVLTNYGTKAGNDPDEVREQRSEIIDIYEGNSRGCEHGV